ncbi:MAG TPA: hypothetical protein VG713_01860 [Pirellulales bacterium]|nr:hypothetical protein [Pirellulales bacterium]
MKRCLLATILCCLGSAGMALAQSPVHTTKPSTTVDQHMSLGQLTPTPEMWFYDQAIREHSDPKAAVRRKAEFESAQRQRRMAAMAWYGMSASRPTANPTPHIGGNYSPVWTSNTRYPWQWSPAATATNVVIVPATPYAAP